MGQACRTRTDGEIEREKERAGERGRERERVLPPNPAQINKEAKSRGEEAEKNFCGF